MQKMGQTDKKKMLLPKKESISKKRKGILVLVCSSLEGLVAPRHSRQAVQSTSQRTKDHYFD